MANVPGELPEETPLASRMHIVIPHDMVQDTRHAAEDILRIRRVDGFRGPLLRMPFHGTTSAYFDQIHSYYDASGNDVRLARKLTSGSIAQFRALLRELQPEQAEAEEYLLAASLHEQRAIAAAFGIAPEALCKVLKLDYGRNVGDGIMDSYYNVYMKTLLEKVRLLRSTGLREEELLHEIAGYIFHEALHSPGDTKALGELLSSDKAIGEVTPITGELAYHMLVKHRRSLFTVEDFERRGVQSLRGNNEGHQKREHMEACAIAYRLLRNSLLAAFPQHAQAAAELQPDSAACWNMLDCITPSEHPALLVALKRALVDSANPSVVRATRQTFVS